MSRFDDAMDLYLGSETHTFIKKLKHNFYLWCEGKIVLHYLYLYYLKKCKARVRVAIQSELSSPSIFESLLKEDTWKGGRIKIPFEVNK